MEVISPFVTGYDVDFPAVDCCILLFFFFASYIVANRCHSLLNPLDCANAVPYYLLHAFFFHPLDLVVTLTCLISI